MAKTTHEKLDCGVELAVLTLPDRRATATEIRVLTGTVDESPEKLGLARLVEETLDKGTETLDGRALSDAFDEIGAGRSSWAGREACGFDSLCLPEFFERNIELHAEFLRRPTFPEDASSIAIELARQELMVLEDDAQSLADKLIARQAYGPILGRHTIGEVETLKRITRDDLVSFHANNYCGGRVVITVAGPLEAEAVKPVIERCFGGFGDATPTHRDPFELQFCGESKHHQKETEQEQISMAFPGVPIDHPDHATERIVLGVLAGGMSARLFTEVREKQGLVYWVGAWHEHPRKAGMVFVGASTTPDRCEKTYTTLLRELDRVAEDVTQEEISRALMGIRVRADIRSDMTRSRCSELADDLFHFGRSIPWEEKLAAMEAVTIDDIKRYCTEYGPGKGLSVVTLGPCSLDK